ncbi:hypothetical protein PGT21_032048 [Puccinia graminis f. sp. tritici]|uniref:Uncharacterized protein n=2 Tax=Puccinia graminis f. sp. tritici TaxID=56615 RepID=A0A5B0NU57_PUCGR|nr:hypothetical protein PGT21_032048 [Puccinia graminis f. sp. tritici]
MSRLSRLSSFDNPQDYATNSTRFGTSNQMQQESSANQISNSSPLTADAGTDLGGNALSSLHSGSPSTLSTPTTHLKAALILSLHDWLAISNFGPLSATSAGKTPTRPKNFTPLPQASSAASADLASDVDQVTQVQTTQPARSTQETKSPSNINNGLSSLSSSFPANLNKTKQGNVAQNGELTPDFSSELGTSPLDLTTSLESSDKGRFTNGQSHKKTNASHRQPDANSLTDEIPGQISQITPNLEPSLAASSSNVTTPTAPETFSPLTKSSSATSISPTSNTDQSTRVQNSRPASITPETKTSPIDNVTSSLSSLFPANLTSSPHANVPPKGKSSAAWITPTSNTDQSTRVQNTRPASITPETKTSPIDNVTSSLSSLFPANLTSSPYANVPPKGKDSANEKPQIEAFPPALPENLESSDTESYENERTPQQIDNSQWQTTPNITTMREEDSSHQNEKSDRETSVTSSSFPTKTSASSTASKNTFGKYPKYQPSQVSSSGGESGDSISQTPPLSGVIPTINSTLSNLTSLNGVFPCQVAANSKESKTPSIPQIGCQNSSDLNSATQTGITIGNLKSPTALQQSSQTSSGYSSKGDLSHVKPLPKNGGKLNSGQDYYKSTLQSKPTADGTSATANDSLLSSNFSSSLSATFNQSSSSSKEFSQSSPNPLLAKAPGNNRDSTVNVKQALGKELSLDSSNITLGPGGLDKPPSLEQGLPPKISHPLLGVESTRNNSTFATPNPLLHASSSSSSSSNTQATENQVQSSSFSESRDPLIDSAARKVENNHGASQVKQATSNEWRISVQNSSSGFSGQSLNMTPNRTHPQLLESKRFGSQNSTQSFNLTQSRSTSQEVDSQLGKSVRASTQTNSRSSAHTSSSSSESTSTTPVSKEESPKSSEQSPASSWIGKTLLPSASPSQDQGYQVSTGGKITVISVGLGFSIGVLILALVGGLMKRRMLRKNRPPSFEISRPKSHLVEEGNSSFSSPRESNMEDGLHVPDVPFHPEYQIPDDEEVGLDPFRTSYRPNASDPHDRYNSYASSFGNFVQPRPDIDQVHYPGQFSSHPQEYLGPGPRRSDGTSVIPITFNQFGGQPRLGPLDLEDDGYGRPEHLPHSGTPWNPHQQQLNEDCGTEVGTRYSDGETMIEDGDAPPVPRLDWDRVPPVPPLNMDRFDR